MTGAVAICGVPSSGKTTSHPSALHADDWLPRSHHYAVNKSASELRKGATVEGCAVVFALEAAAGCLREVRWYGRPRVQLTPQQSRFARRCLLEWERVRPKLIAMGVTVVDVQ